MNSIKTSKFDGLFYAVILSDLCAYFFEPTLVTKLTPFVLGVMVFFYITSHSIEYISLCLFLAIIFITCKLVNQDSSLNLATVLINIALGWYLYLQKPKDGPWTILMSLIFLLLAFRFYTSRGDISNVLLSAGENHISVIALSVSLFYYTLSYKKCRLVSLTPALITLLFSIIATGRSGIICSTFLISGIFLYNLILIKKTGTVNFFYAISGLIVVWLLYINANLLYEISNSSSLLWRFRFDYTTDGRIQILEAYFSDLSVLNFIFGRSSTFISNRVGMSVHISYLQWHISFGFFAFAMYITVGFAYLKMFLVNKVYFILMTVLLIRGATDHVLLTAGFSFGVLLTYFCLISYAPNYDKFRH